MGNRSHTIYLGLQNNIVFVKIYGTESTLKKYEAESTLMEQTMFKKLNLKCIKLTFFSQFSYDNE
jgi:hypothetical protein